jgi:hypothetical protein
LNVRFLDHRCNYRGVSQKNPSFPIQSEVRQMLSFTQLLLDVRFVSIAVKFAGCSIRCCGLFRNLRRVIDERQIWDEPTFAAARMYW